MTWASPFSADKKKKGSQPQGWRSPFGSTASSAPTQAQFTRPPLKNLGDLLDFQRASIFESRYRRGSSDANMAANRQELGIDKFYNREGHTLGVPAIDKFLTHAGRGAIDIGLQTAQDPLTWETFGAGVPVKAAARLLSPALRAGEALLPEATRASIAAGKGLWHTLGAAYSDLAHYAPEARRDVGVTKLRETLGAKKAQQMQQQELERRLQGLRGTIPDKQLNKVLVRMKARPGSGAIPKVSQWGTGARATDASRTIRVEPRIPAQPQPMRRQLFAKLKTMGLSPEYRRAMIEDALGTQSLKGATPHDMMRLFEQFDLSYEPQSTGLLNATHQVRGKIGPREDPQAIMAELTPEEQKALQQYGADINAGRKPEPLPEGVVDRLRRAEAAMGPIASEFRYGGNEPLSDLGVAILKKPGYVKGPFGKLQRDPKIAARPGLSLVARSGYKAPEIPDAIKEFNPRYGQMTASNVRLRYEPSAPKKVDPNAPPPTRTYNALESFDPHLRSAKFMRPAKTQAERDAAMEAALKSSARHITLNNMRVTLGKIHGLKPDEVGHVTESIRKLFDGKQPIQDGHWNTLGDLWKAGVDSPKFAVYGSTPMHIANMTDLFVTHPELIPEAMYNLTKMYAARGNHAKLWESFGREAAQYGGGRTMYDTGKGLTSLPYFKQMSDLTWNVDEALWLPLAKKYERQGMSKLEAGQAARDDMVNYEQSSRAQKAGKYVMPFAQFALGKVGAVTRAAVRRPVQLEAANRATGGKLLGGGTWQTGKYYGPTAAVGRLFDIDDAVNNFGKPGQMFPGATAFARSNLSPLISIPLYLLGFQKILAGKKPVQSALLRETPIPYLQDAADLTGASGYKPDDWLHELIFATSGYSP